jgi:hypothetical protein
MQNETQTHKEIQMKLVLFSELLMRHNRLAKLPNKKSRSETNWKTEYGIYYFK